VKTIGDIIVLMADSWADSYELTRSNEDAILLHACRYVGLNAHRIRQTSDPRKR